MKHVFNLFAKITVLLMAVTFCAFVVEAAPQKITGVSVEPTYKFDYEAPRDKNKVTVEICVQVGYVANGISQAISKGESNKEIQTRLYMALSENMTDRTGMVAATMLYSIIDEMRTWPKQNGYQQASAYAPKADRHSLYQILAEVRCKGLIGTDVETPKVVRVVETLK